MSLKEAIVSYSFESGAIIRQVAALSPEENCLVLSLKDFD